MSEFLNGGETSKIGVHHNQKVMYIQKHPTNWIFLD